MPPNNYNLRTSLSAVALQETKYLVQVTENLGRIDIATCLQLEKFPWDDTDDVEEFLKKV